MAFLDNPTVQEYDGPRVGRGERTFTVQGAAIKSLFLLAILACTFGYTWQLSTQNYTAEFVPNAAGELPDSINIPDNVIHYALAGCFGGFVVALVIIFARQTAPYLSPVYAALEGLALGAISAGFEAKYPGIALQATGSTIGVTFGMLTLYSLGILRPTEKFMVGLLAAMTGIMVLYFVDIIMFTFGGNYIPVVHSAGPWGIAIQVVIVIVAACNLIPDFGLIAESAENKAPKSHEWYAAFSLLITLVWLYIEILKLLAKLRSNDDD